MPELPEVTIFKEYFDSTSLHREIKDVTVSNEFVLKDISVNQFQNKLKGQQFDSTERRGKYLFIEVSPEKFYLLLHFGMTGSLSYYKSTGDQPDYARIIIDFKNGFHLSYNSQRMLGEIRLLDNMQEYIEEHKIGRDAMDKALTEEAFKKLLDHRKGIVKSVLMNQEVISGIGNEFSDEILFHAKIHPKTKIQDLSDTELHKIYKQMKEVLQTAIDHRTNYGELKDSFLLANREKEGKCPNCHSKLETIQVSGRTAYYCPKCQSTG